jgi:hypothetical protein
MNRNSIAAVNNVMRRNCICAPPSSFDAEEPKGCEFDRQRAR